MCPLLLVLRQHRAPECHNRVAPFDAPGSALLRSVRLVERSSRLSTLAVALPHRLRLAAFLMR
jgi:hypothetical protein